MALTDATNKEEAQKEFVDVIEYIEQEDKERNKKRMLSWAASIAVHLVVMAFMALIIYSQRIQVDEPAIQTAYITPPQKIEKNENRELEQQKQNPVEIEVETEEIVKNPVVNLEFEQEELSAETEIDDPNPKPEGREDANAVSEMGGEGFVGVIGAGGPGSGAYGFRNPTGRKKGLGKLGPNARGAESSLNAGLRWLKRHQSPNGQWDTDQYFVNCTDAGPKCEPGKNQAGNADVAMTGYAILCFLGNGYDHRMSSMFKPTVKRGIDWLLSIQDQKGVLGIRNYEHAVATMALCEAYGMSNDPALKEPAQKALDVLIERQTKDKDYGLAWNYVDPNPSRQDTSVSGWCVMALKSGAASGLNVHNGLEGSKSWLEKTWKAANGNWKTLDPYGKSIFPYVWNSETDKTEKEHLSFVGAACAVFLGHKAGDVMLETMLNDMDDRWLAKCSVYPHNSYASYYAMMAAFQGGGEHWKKWMNGIVPPLLKAQRKDGCFDGSWDNAIDFHGADTGRILSTTYALLNLSVVFRYAPIGDQKEMKKLTK